MTHRQVATLACRILAIWALIDALRLLEYPLRVLANLVRSHGQWPYSGQWPELIGSGLHTVLQIVVALWLWWRAGVVAVWMTGQMLQDEPDEREISPQRASMDEVQAIVLASLGVLFALAVSSGVDRLGRTLRSLRPGRQLQHLDLVVSTAAGAVADLRRAGHHAHAAPGAARRGRARGNTNRSRLTPHAPAIAGQRRGCSSGTVSKTMRSSRRHAMCASTVRRDDMPLMRSAALRRSPNCRSVTSPGEMLSRSV